VLLAAFHFEFLLKARKAEVNIQQAPMGAPEMMLARWRTHWAEQLNEAYVQQQKAQSERIVRQA